jgi:hypothetical protein
MLTDAGLFRDLVELRNIAPSVFTPVPAKHAKSFNLNDTLAVGSTGYREAMNRCGARWSSGGRRKSATNPKLILYAVFVDGKLKTPRRGTRSSAWTCICHSAL